MDDIVQELRAYAEKSVMEELLIAAADEIERLRAEVERLTRLAEQVTQARRAEVGRLRAENDRLLGALMAVRYHVEDLSAATADLSAATAIVSQAAEAGVSDE